MDILYLSPADWAGARGRFQHIAERLSAGNRVLYVDGLGVRRLATRDWRRVIRKLARYLMPVESHPGHSPSLRCVTPLSIPGQGSALIRRFNRWFLLRYLRRQMRHDRFENPIVWLSYPHPDLVELLDHLSPRAVVYDCVDHWREFTNCYPNIAEAEDSVLRRADLVVTTTPSLLQRAFEINPHSFLVPNGVDVDAFTGSRNQIPEDLQAIPSPRIGFVGNIADWVDLDMVERLAKSNPHWHFVMVGPYQIDTAKHKADNLHWMGYRPYERIPNYVGGFDVGIIPFISSELTQSVDPLKLYEYLAAGIPVVSTPMPRAHDFSDVIAIADDDASFTAAIRSSLENGGDPTARVAAARSHGWAARVEYIASIMRSELQLDVGGATGVAP